MTPEAKKRYDEKVARVEAAIALKEPDRVPMMPSAALFPMLNAGYTVAEVIYDTSLEKMTKSIVKYLEDFDPDAGLNTGTNYAGEGPMLELEQPKNMRWAGMPGKIIDDNSIQQFIEFPTLLDDEFDEFFSDRTGWTMRKSLPRESDLLKPLVNFQPGRGAMGMANALSTPEMREMIQTLWKISDGYKEYFKKRAAISREIEEAGYPILRCSMAAVPFDHYSDFLRGTLDGCADLYERPEIVMAYCEETLAGTLESVKLQGKMMPGKHVFMALHKGMDGFMSDEHYREFYWNHLQIIINTIIEAGMVPYIYTEGKYNSRLECLKEVPKGKVIYHFEEVDMVQAKKILGDTACIAGGVPVYLLDYGTKEQVIDEAKRLIDACAPGGGFIFETSCGIDLAKKENMEALRDTVRTYGKR